MKKYTLFTLFAVATLLNFSCSRQNKAQENTQSNAEKKITISLSQLATNTDLSCGMKFTSASEVGDTMTYNGKLYGFCSKECRDNFAADPQKFVKQ
jgi:YHS domain-containing protein